MAVGSAISVFEARLSEVNFFLEFIRKLQKKKSSPGMLHEIVGSIPILKACLILMFYNIVESSVRTAFEDMYQKIESENLDLLKVSEELQNIWLIQQFDDIKAESANKNTYFKTVQTIVTTISSSQVITLGTRKLPISGNLDADQIRSLCGKHGIELKVTKWAKGGIELAVIKEQRNALAHGHKSFAECGRDYEIDDLKRIFKQTTHFLRCFFKSLDRYQSSNKYRK